MESPLRSQDVGQNLTATANNPTIAATHATELARIAPINTDVELGSLLWLKSTTPAEIPAEMTTVTIKCLS